MAVLFHDGDNWVKQYNGVKIKVVCLPGNTMIWCDGERLPHWKLLEVSCEPIEKPTRNGYSREWMASVDKYATVTLWDGTIYHGLIIQDERNGEDMSSTLYWRPTCQLGKSLGYSLKKALRRQYGGHGEGRISELRLCSSDMSILQGMLSAGVEEARILLDEIQKHGAVFVYEDD